MFTPPTPKICSGSSKLVEQEASPFRGTDEHFSTLNHWCESEHTAIIRKMFRRLLSLLFLSAQENQTHNSRDERYEGSFDITMKII